MVNDSRSAVDGPAVEAAPGDWVSARIYFRGGIYSGACDGLLTDVVLPFVRKGQHAGLGSFFFIRSGDQGPHVRLQMRGTEAGSREELVHALEAHLAAAEHELMLAAPYAEPADLIRVSRLSSLRWTAFAPVADRLGGAGALASSAELPGASSDLALSLVAARPGQPRAERMGRALMTLATLIAAFATDAREAADLAGWYRDDFVRGADGSVDMDWTARFETGWSAQADEFRRQLVPVWNATASPSRLPPPLRRYHAAAVAVSKRLGAVSVDERPTIPSAMDGRAVLLSRYCRLFNNQLGVSPPEECFQFHLLSAALRPTNALASFVRRVARSVRRPPRAVLGTL